MNTNIDEIIKKLKEPFRFEDIEWKLQVTTKDKARGLAVAYIDSRAIQKRLDETVGPFNWRTEYQPWQDKAQICKLYIFCPDRGDWVEKSDGAENSDIEPIKGGLSDAFKRAASQWGIGRYLYDIDGVWVEIEPKGNSSSIKPGEYANLRAKYDKAVSVISGQSKGSNGSAQRSETPPQTPSKPVPPQSQAKENEKPDSGAENAAYKIQSVSQSGKSSVLLELAGNDGKTVRVYASNSSGLKTGMLLRKVSIEQKMNGAMPYNVLNAFEAAA